MDNSGKRQLQNTCIQEESPMDMTPRIHYEVSCHNQRKKEVLKEAAEICDLRLHPLIQSIIYLT